jgi:V8-like Glu-specific endopeptidase
MKRALGRSGALGAFVALALACSPVAAHAEIPVVELGPGAGEATGAELRPLRAPGRLPAERFRRTRRGGAGASSIRVLNASESGTRTNGKLIGVDPHRGAYSCSGTALNTESRSIVLTAGHCVVQSGSAGRRLSFIPAYDHGERPFGSFEVTVAYVMPQWAGHANPDFDLAALRVAPNRLGALTDVVGGRGFATSRSRFAPFQIFGYPAAALRGEELRSCRAKGLGSDPLTFVFGGPPALPSSCDMAAGASGGGWLIDGEYVNGVTSYSYPTRPTRLHSPYFGPAAAAFLRSLP